MRLAMLVPSRVRASAVVAATALALAGCPNVDFGDQPPDPGLCRPDFQYYKDVVWPQFLAPADPARSCVTQSGCHQVATGRSALRLETNPVDDTRNYQVVTRFLNCATPEASPLLGKPLVGDDPHGGGDLFPSTADPAVVSFLGWFP